MNNDNSNDDNNNDTNNNHMDNSNHDDQIEHFGCTLFLAQNFLFFFKTLTIHPTGVSRGCENEAEWL